MGKKKERRSAELTDDAEHVEQQISVKKVQKRKNREDTTDVEDALKRSLKKASKKRKKRDDSALAKEESIGADSHTIENGVIRKPPSAKSFPLASKIAIPTREQMKRLPSEAQNSCFTALGRSCEQLLHLINDTEAATTLWRESKKDSRDPVEASVALEDDLVADLARLKGVPLARQFAELSLWKRLKRFNEKQQAYIRSLRGEEEKQNEEADTNGHLGAKEVNGSKPTEEFLSFKAAHMKHMTTAFAGDLEKIREAENLDVVGVETLLRFLEEGAELYATTMTYKT